MRGNFFMRADAAVDMPTQVAVETHDPKSGRVFVRLQPIVESGARAADFPLGGAIVIDMVKTQKTNFSFATTDTVWASIDKKRLHLQMLITRRNGSENLFSVVGDIYFALRLQLFTLYGVVFLLLIQELIAIRIIVGAQVFNNLRAVFQAIGSRISISTIPAYWLTNALLFYFPREFVVMLFFTTFYADSHKRRPSGRFLTDVFLMRTGATIDASAQIAVETHNLKSRWILIGFQPREEPTARSFSFTLNRIATVHVIQAQETKFHFATTCAFGSAVFKKRLHFQRLIVGHSGSRDSFSILGDICPTLREQFFAVCGVLPASFRKHRLSDLLIIFSFLLRQLTKVLLTVSRMIFASAGITATKSPLSSFVPVGEFGFGFLFAALGTFAHMQRLSGKSPSGKGMRQEGETCVFC